jgi:hypothetical protein
MGGTVEVGECDIVGAAGKGMGECKQIIPSRPRIGNRCGRGAEAVLQRGDVAQLVIGTDAPGTDFPFVGKEVATNPFFRKCLSRFGALATDW